jgi:hypothetical protein
MPLPSGLKNSKKQTIMKKFALIFLSYFMTVSCQCKKETVAKQPDVVQENVTPKIALQENNQTSDMVEYEALSRGYFKRITFQNNIVTISSDRNNPEKGEVVKLSNDDVQEINKLIKAINPEILPNLKGLSEKRFYDGAAHANLKITSKGITHNGPGFDHGDPPKEIEKLVTKLVSFSEKK